MTTQRAYLWSDQLTGFGDATLLYNVIAATIKLNNIADILPTNKFTAHFIYQASVRKSMSSGQLKRFFCEYFVIIL